MQINVNCVSNRDGAWCNDKRVKRSLWGMGARCCIEYNGKHGECPYRVSYPKCKLIHDKVSPFSGELTEAINKLGEQINIAESTIMNKDSILTSEDKQFLRNCLNDWLVEELPKGMCPTFYKTLTYEGDLAIINRIKKILD